MMEQLTTYYFCVIIDVVLMEITVVGDVGPALKNHHKFVIAGFFCGLYL